MWQKLQILDCMHLSKRKSSSAGEVTSYSAQTLILSVSAHLSGAFTQSHNHRTGQVGQDHLRSSGPTPCSSRVIPENNTGLCPDASGISPERETPHPPRAAVPELCQPQWKGILAHSKVELLVFYVTAIAPHLSLGNRSWKESGTNLLTPTWELFICTFLIDIK